MDLTSAQFAVLAGTIPALVIALVVERPSMPISGTLWLDRWNNASFPWVVVANGMAFFVALAGIVRIPAIAGYIPVFVVAVDFLLLALLLGTAMSRQGYERDKTNRRIDREKLR